MILLPGPAPADASSFADVIHELLTGAVAVSRDRVTVAGGFPTVASLAVDLTGAVPTAHPAGQTLAESDAGAVRSAVTVESLSVIGHPFGPAEMPVRLDVAARHVVAEFVEPAAAGPAARVALRLAGAAGGRFTAAVDKDAVRRAIVEEGGKLAAAQGVTIKGAAVTWTSPDPRTLAIEVEVDAKKGFFPATVVVRGRLLIDSSLTATLSGLDVEGKGMGGTIGATLLRPRLAKYEGYARSLLALPLDAIRVRDVRFAATAERLTVEGEFGG